MLNTIRIVVCAAVLGALLGSTGCSSDHSTPTPTDPTVSDDAPPLAPTGLRIVKSEDGRCTLRWNESAEADLAGYFVYVYDPDQVGPKAYTALQRGPIPRPTFVFSRSLAPTRRDSYFICVSAVDLAGHESGISETLTVELTAPPPREQLSQEPDAPAGDPTDVVAPPDIREPAGGPGHNPAIDKP